MRNETRRSRTICSITIAIHAIHTSPRVEAMAPSSSAPKVTLMAAARTNKSNLVTGGVVTWGGGERGVVMLKGWW